MYVTSLGQLIGRYSWYRLYCIVLYCIILYIVHWSHLFSGSSPVLSKWPLWQEKGEWEACWLGSAILTPSESNSPRRIVRELPETAVPGVKHVRWKWRRGNSCPWCESSDAENDDDWNELRSEMCGMKRGRWTSVKWNKKCEDESNEMKSVKMSQTNERCENGRKFQKLVKANIFSWYFFFLLLDTLNIFFENFFFLFILMDTYLQYLQ